MMMMHAGHVCPLPKNPMPHSRPFGPRLFYPTPKLVPTPLSPGSGTGTGLVAEMLDPHTSSAGTTRRESIDCKQVGSAGRAL